MAFIKTEECDEWKDESKERDFQKSDSMVYGFQKSESMVYEEDNESMDSGLTFAVVTLEDTDEVMVVASDWLSTDQKQCYWPPFKSTEKYLEAVKSNLEPSTGGKPWEKINVLLHAKYDTYEEAENNQVEQRALKDGLNLYKVVTLKKSNELTVIPAKWQNEERTHCYWPPFKSPEKCTEAVKNRLEPSVPVNKPWEMLDIQVHGECATYKQAKEKQKAFKEQKERSTLHSAPASSLQISRFSRHGTKRKRDCELSDSSRESLLTTDMEIMLKAKQIMKRVTDNLAHTINMHNYIISKINKMNTVNRKKATIGIFGKTGEGKSSLLSAILGEKDLLPSGCFGACTAVVTQVEANLTDSNYTAEIELISKEEWEKELKDLFRDLQDDSEDRNEDLIEIAVEKITALYGDDADQKTLEELQKDDKYAEIENFLSISKKTISNNDVSEFASDVARFIQHSESSPGDWYWPLVKSVNIKIPDRHELLEHIVIVDIPGTGDCNKTRDKLRECSAVWIVSNINRAITERDPWGILKHCIEELGLGRECKHINFICTKTDDINPAACMRSARLTFPTDKDQKIKCIRHRNEEAKTKVKEKFEKSEIKYKFRTDSNFFQVFTVSSSAFFNTSLNLEPAETEIPKLQDVLRSINKSINRELTRDYVSEAKGVLSLIQSVQLDTDKKAAEMKVTIRMDLENNLKKALSEMDKYFDSIYNDLEKCLSKGVEKSVQSCVASTKALVAPKNDGRGFYKTLQTLCENYGCYGSKNRDAVLDLNKRLADPLHENIDDHFNQIFPVSGMTGRSVQEQIDKFTIIQSDPAYPRSSVVRHIQNFIKTEEAKLKASLIRDTVELKKKIYSSIIKTIQNEMSPCYEEAAALTGTGSRKKRQDMLVNTVDEKKHHMFSKAKMEVLKKLKHLEINIKDVLEAGLKKAMDLSLSQSSNTTLMDVSREIDQMEAFLKQ